ncbi:MAG: DUF2520 domain-containing protein [Elusimicrobia bacterium]|nr:DUF2520 domain-containing protein [Elusimicrobiota bacterium]
MKHIVPAGAPYGIIGGGKASKHLQAYFRLLKTPCIVWRRNSGQNPETALKNCKKVFLLIKDSEIEPFITKNPFLKTKTLLHFSGSLSSRRAIGIHPFMPLAARTLSLARYRRIPFALEPGSPPLKKLVPEFKNPFFRIRKGQKALYHALCVLGANLPVILWRKALKELNKKFRIPRKYIFNYFRAALDNFDRDPSAGLSGPLERKDTKTVRANLKALRGDPFREIYAAFAGIYRNGTNESGNRNCKNLPPPLFLKEGLGKRL